MLRRRALNIVRVMTRRGLSTTATTATTATAKLPDLPYSYGALEPAISGQIMELHHSKHHNAYVTNYNAALEQYKAAEQKGAIGDMINLQGAIKFNGGGHLNHSIFWTNLAPTNKGGGVLQASSAVAKAIDQKWKSFENFQKTMTTTAAAIQGSGWAWLTYNKTAKGLDIVTMANQDPVTGNLVPLLGFDMWEHAYYLQYKNVRPDYLSAIWKVVNWQNIDERFKAASS